VDGAGFVLAAASGWLAVVAGDDAGSVVGFIEAVSVAGLDGAHRVWGFGGVAGLDVPAGEEQLAGHG
jgi:hypothetical protein